MMCQAIIEKPNQNVDYIIYNHLFSKNDYSFTIDELVDALKDYNLNLKKEFVKKTIDSYIDIGLIVEGVSSYSICG